MPNSIKSLIILVLITSFNTSYAKPLPESSSGIIGKRYVELVRYLFTLPSKYPNMVRLINYGTTQDKKPLIALKIGLTTNTTIPSNQKKYAILLTGATHGNEYLGFEDLLPEWFASVGIKDPESATYFSNGGVIYIIPIFNPDGFDKLKRENSNNVDLNRDFPSQFTKYNGFTQPETRLAAQMLDAYLNLNKEKLIFSMDYHCCNRSALYPWSVKGAPEIPRQYQINFDLIGDIMKIVFSKNFRVGNTPEILNYSAIGTSKDYYFEKYGSLSFTYEGEAEIEKKKFEQHLLVLRSIISLLQKLNL